MLALLTQSPKKTATSPRKHARLGVEQLETRFCPSGLQFTNFAVVPDNNSKWVDLSGTVTDSNPSSVTVTFGGVVSGSTHADATGHFDVHLLASGLGAVTASGVDQDAASASAYATVAATAPSLTLNLAYGPNRTVTLSGKVTDAQPNGLVVTFAGVVTGSATADANGNFSVTLTPSALGQITATTTDVWGLNSAAASVTVVNSAPTITLTATQLGNIWTFSGHVSDEYAPGLTVKFGGPSDISGRTVTVGSDGNFSLTIMLSAKDTGFVTATVIDWWGLAAEADFALPTSHGGNGGGGG
jgi:hypothetical protein